jgi:hypothetical protein
MSTTAAGSTPALVSDKEITNRVILESELRRLDAQLLTVTPGQDRSPASGTDPKAKHKEILKQRDHVLRELKKLRPSSASPAQAGAFVGPPLVGSLLSAPIVPGRFTTGLGSWFGGYAGSVQMGAAEEFELLTPTANYSGNFYTESFDVSGGVMFTGDCDSQDLPQNPDSPPFKWLESWRNVVPFPPPTVDSWFTYSFGVDVQIPISTSTGSGDIAAYIFLGESANGTAPAATIEMGPPCVYHINPPSDFVLRGFLQTRRSLYVRVRDIPVVSLMLYIVCNEDPNTTVSFGDCSFIPHSEGGEGRVNFRYDPIIVSRA